MIDKNTIAERARKIRLKMLDGMVDIHAYDNIIVFFSGGKDSMACLLHLLDLGVDRSKLELWHHEIDGREGSTLMDWPCTAAYCKAVAKAFNIPIYYSWRKNGFEGELNKGAGEYSHSYMYEDVSGQVVEVPIDKKRITNLDGRIGFPQQSMNLSLRWCSGHLKIDVAARAITAQDRFNGKKVLTVSGERGEESAGRAKMQIYGSDKGDTKTKRTVHRWRPVRDWLETDVWAIIEKYKVRCHPCYYLGFGRCSCAICIFANANQLASVLIINPSQIHGALKYEHKLGKTIDRSPQKLTILQKAQKGKAYIAIQNKEHVKDALNRSYNRSIILKEWSLPAGAYGEKAGPN